MSQRTFQHRVTAPSVAVIVLIAVLALYFFLARETMLAFVAFLLVCLDVVMIERLVHTSYVLTDDGMLVIDKGRFARRLTIPVGDIIRIERRRPLLPGMQYLLIEYGLRKYVSIQPDNEPGFIGEITKRQKQEM